ncbi:MAG: rod-binding protein [Desulfosoma sp.]
MSSISSIHVTETSAPSKGTDKEKNRLKQACMDFESLLAAQLVTSMRASVLRDEEPDHAMGLYESMLDEGLADVWSRQESLGLGRWLYRSLEPLMVKKEEPR